MSSTSGPKIATSGLILDLDPASPKCYPGSGTSVYDLGGSGTASMLDSITTPPNFPTFTTTAVGSWSFGGDNDYISVDNSSRKFQWTPSGAGNNTLVFEMWVKSTDTVGYYLSKPWNSNGEYNILMTHTLFAMGTNTLNFAVSFSTLSTGNWEHIAAIATPTQFLIYRNGVLNTGPTNHGLTVNTPSNGDYNNTIPLSIMTLYPYGQGYSRVLPDFGIQGSVGLFRVYNRLLSADEVLNNYNMLKGRFGY